jgi:hypothetical protein
MAPGMGLALRRALRGDEHRPLGVCRECVGDATEEGKFAPGACVTCVKPVPSTFTV